MAQILFIHQNFPGQFRHLAPALAALGHEVLALGTTAETQPLPGVRYFRHRPAAAKVNGSPMPQLRDLVSKILRGESAAESLQRLKEMGFRPDVICVHPGWGEGLFVRDIFPSAKIIMYAEYYYESTGGDVNFDPEFSVAQKLEQMQRTRLRNTHLLHAMSTADAGLSPTQFQRDRHPMWFRERTVVIHDGIDSERFQPNSRATIHLARSGLTLRPGDEVITFVARQLEPYRGYHVFMRALPILQKIRPHARIVIVGGDGTSYGPPPPVDKTWKNIYRDEVRDKLNMERIHFVGRLPHHRLTELMQVSAVYTYLTYPFVLSWSLMEALSTGCLIVASKTAPVEEVIEHGRNGLLTDFFDSEALAHTIAEAIRNQHCLSELRSQARKTIRDRYDLRQHCLPAQIHLLLQ